MDPPSLCAFTWIYPLCTGNYSGTLCLREGGEVYLTSQQQGCLDRGNRFEQKEEQSQPALSCERSHCSWFERYGNSKATISSNRRFYERRNEISYWHDVRPDRNAA